MDPVNIERVGGFSWRPFGVLGMIALVVGVGILKPWELDRPALLSQSSRPHLASAVANATAEPTPIPTPTVDPAIDAASGRMLCNAPAAWRLISAETGVLGESRTMYGVDPVTATGPADPSIPTVELDATHMYALGVCRPNPGGKRVADLPFNNVTIWREDGRQPPLAVVQPRVLSDSLYRLGEVYFGPPGAYPLHTADTASRPSWQPGRYVIEILGAAPHNASLWLALYFLAQNSQAGAPVSR